MRTVYIQKEKGEFHLPANFSAWRGFSLMGDDTIPFEYGEMKDLPLTKETIVFGGVRSVKEALVQIGVAPPPPIDFPECLDPFFGRKIAQSTMGAIRKAEGEEGFEPIFIKPVEHTKSFTGHVISRFRDLIKTAGIPSNYPVWTSEVVSFVSEYRCFILRGKVIGCRNYKGDPLVFPDPHVVKQAVRVWSRAGAPVSCALDVGVTTDHLTLVVEVNDGHSLGDYGLPSLDYARMIESRWDEMVGNGPSRRSFNDDSLPEGGVPVDNR